MATAISFGEANSGLQGGIFNGPVNTQFHHHAPPERPETPPNPSIVIPFSRDTDFVERGILDQIHQKCAVSGSRTALVGLGGVGKSQLAIEYAYRTQDRSPETWVFWIHASNAVRFEQSFRDIADCIKISGRQNPSANIFQLVHDWLRDDKKGKWTLILDNVDDASFLVKAQSTGQDEQTNIIGSKKVRPLVEYLPQCSNGSILITSRSKSAALNLVEQCDIIEVEPMSKADALALFNNKLGRDDDNDNTAKLAATLEFMPLAIVQAAAYISQREPRCSVEQYLQDFHKSDHGKINLLDNEAGHLRRDKEARNSIINTWRISFTHIRRIRPSAAGLLALMSLCDRQGIPESLVQSQAKVETSLQKKPSRGIHLLSHLLHYNRDRHSGKTQDSTSNKQIDGFEDDVLMLRNYSFISTSKSRSTFEMHALVQLAMRTWMETNGQLEHWKQRHFKNLCAVFPTGNYENWPRCQELFPHALLAVAQKPKELDSLGDWASILYKAAYYAWSIGKGEEAEKMSVQAMVVRKKILGSKHEDTLDSIAIVGLVYTDRGNYDAAEPLLQKTLQLRKKVLGKEHPDTLTSMNNLAYLLQSQGKYNAAEPLYQKTLQLREKVLGKEHPNTLASMNNFAGLLQRQGKYDAAEPLYQKTLQLSKKVLGKEHPDTLASMNNLAYLLQSQGKYDAAEPLYQKTLQLREKVLGKEHPNTLTSMNNLASLLESQGKYDVEVRYGLTLNT